MPEQDDTATAPTRSPAIASVHVLSLMCEAQRPLSTEDIGRELALSARAAEKIVRALEDEGYTAADPATGLHVVGPRLLRMARLARSYRGMEKEIRGIMRELVEATGETVTYNTYSPGTLSSVCVIVEASPAPLHYAVEVGEVKPLHAGSSGRAILAHLSAQEVEDYISRTGLPALTSRTITDSQLLSAELERIRQDGYAMSMGQRVDGAVAIAGSVFDADGRIQASLVLTTPSYRFRTEDQGTVVDHVRRAAQRLSGLVVDIAGN